MAACEMNGEEHEAPGKIVVITFSEECTGEDVVKGIIKTDEKLEPVCLEGNISYFPWGIKNKYYSTELLIGFTNDNDHKRHDLKLLEQADAFIFCLDLADEQQLKNVESWLPCLDTFSPSIQLLFGSETLSDQVSEKRRHDILLWCAEHSFEMIEQYPGETSDTDDFPEKYGYDRVIEALQIHTWPNMEMNEIAPMGNLKPVETRTTPDNVLNDTNTDQPKDDFQVKEIGYEALLNQMDDTHIDDVDGQSFEELFDKLKEMKDRAMNMPLEDRKDYAEKVAVAFWKALGGDDEEIEGV